MKLISPRVIRGNRGDLLSRWGILCGLRDLGAEPFDVFCSDPRHLPAGFRPLPYGPLYNLLPPPSTWRALKDADAVIWAGGLDLQDDSSLAKLVHTLCTFAFYRLLGLKIICVMQGAGPLTTRAGRRLAKAVLNRVALFLARDPGTAALLESLGSNCAIRLCHDGIFLPGFLDGPVPETDAEAIRRCFSAGSSSPVVAVNLRMWFHFSSSLIPYQFNRARYEQRATARMDGFVAAVAEVIERLRRERDAHVVLVSMYEPGVEPWEDDLRFLRAVKARLSSDPHVVVADHDFSIPGFQAYMSGFDLVIGARLHSTLTALRAGVPALHIAYTLKGRDIFRSLGLEEFAFALERFLDDPGALADCAVRMLDDSSLKPRLARVVEGAVAENRGALAAAFPDLAGGRACAA